ncbi:MAG: LuxR C-terminal-related transcriptional regulator [Deltaproteobacteria bacterium]|nr:LuxR C-terminal-related transcriptional regulator [Deltaproteobacteria bacterium]
MTGKPNLSSPSDISSRKDQAVPPFPFRWLLAPSEESDPARVEWALRERIKELNCLYAIAQLAEPANGTIDEVLEGTVAIIPPSWQYPEVTCARISFLDKTYKSPDFKLTSWRQSSVIYLYGEPAGEVTVCYREERPPAYEGPFLHEERVLLDAVAERIGAIAMRMVAEQELQETNRQLLVERQTLKETNTTLRTIMARVEEEKREIHRDIRDNVEKVLMPILQELFIAVPKSQRKFVELLQENLEEITSPFVSYLSTRFQALTPTEIQICTMIKSGLRTKEIAELRGVSPATINRHRERIRHKLGITNSDVNLATFLSMSMQATPKD